MAGILEYIEYVGNQFANIKMVDIIDIFIVTLLLYWVFKFAIGRRAGKLIVGLVLFALLALLSNFLGLRALNYILDAVFSVGIVALVIVFQPELRSALERFAENLNITRIRDRLDNDENSDIRSAISEICTAAEGFSRAKTGALIVFERTTRLGDVIRTGTTIDALVSTSIIGNIFFNKAPLHDGAVVIREGRVHAAGCFLPLSDTSGIDKKYGTRHRAALGMSENSDAVVLVVSEETGGISVACKGDLKTIKNLNSLESYLSSLLIQEKKKNITDRVKGKFFKIKHNEEDGNGSET